MLNTTWYHSDKHTARNPPTCSPHGRAGLHQINDGICEAQRAGNLDRARDELRRDANTARVEEVFGHVRERGTDGLAVQLVDGSVFSCNDSKYVST